MAKFAMQASKPSAHSAEGDGTFGVGVGTQKGKGNKAIALGKKPGTSYTDLKGTHASLGLI